MLVVLACNIWLCLYDLSFCISPVFVAAGVADAATHIFSVYSFFKHAPETNHHPVVVSNNIR